MVLSFLLVSGPVSASAPTDRLVAHTAHTGPAVALPPPPSVSFSSAAFEVNAGVDPATEQHLARSKNNFTTYQPADISRTATGPVGHSSSVARYRADISSSTQEIDLNASGLLVATAACTRAVCGDTDPGQMPAPISV